LHNLHIGFLLKCVGGIALNQHLKLIHSFIHSWYLYSAS